MNPNQLTNLFQLLSEQFQVLPPAASLRFQAIGGGNINDAYRLSTTEGRSWFCKLNDTDRFPGLFEKEVRGLELLGSKSIFRIPTKIACTSIFDHQILVLEWIGEGLRTDSFWKGFGEKLARLHRLSQSGSPSQSGSGRPYFGLDHSNYMGALQQDNTPSDSFVDFFIHRRLQPQVELAVQNKLMDLPTAQRFANLYTRLVDIFPMEAPALLHGDLWSGNFLADESGEPVLIDPAVYYGHRSIDLAMTTLFGGFERPFYESYAYHYPFPPNYQEQWDICNLYPLLVHLNLFGKKTFVGRILSTLPRP